MSDYEVMKTSEEHVSGLPFLSQLMRNFGKEQLWDREDYKCLGSDYGGDRASSPPQAGSQSYGTEERGYHFPVSKCEERPLTDAGYRNLFTNLGVSSGLVQRAIQELDQTGEGVDYDMLLEDLLSRTAQQDPQASNSRTSSKKPKRRVKILAEECGYDSKTVKRGSNKVNSIMFCNFDVVA